MEDIRRCFLFTVDESPESLRPIGFLARLHTRLDDVGVLICHFYSPLAPVYQQRPLAPAMAAKKEELLRARQEKIQAIVHQARLALMQAGFAADNIQEYIQERSVSQTQHACSLASLKRLDGILVNKPSSGKLEGILGEDPVPALLEHCHASPVWFIDGTHINTGRAVVCVHPEQASLRAARHAASMLARSGAHVDLLHCDPRLPRAVVCGADQDDPALRSWEQTPNGRALVPFLRRTREILEQEGVATDCIGTEILPVSGDVASTILAHCRQNDIGIAVLGHSKPEGMWSFLRNSVTKKILADFKNMAIWVVQQGTKST